MVLWPTILWKRNPAPYLKMPKIAAVRWLVASVAATASCISLSCTRRPNASAEEGTELNQTQPARNRRAFSRLLAQIKDGDTPARVAGLLGRPDDVQYASNAPPYRDEVWCYGTSGHGSLATLGKVDFRGQRVLWVAGAYGLPPSPLVISERELQAGMRFLHPGPEAAGYNDPLQLIRVTNYLLPLGKAKALAIVSEYGRVGGADWDETWLFLLLRTLFDVPDPPGYMPEMFIGAMAPDPGRDRRKFPRYPIVIVDEVPFSVLWGVSLGGMPEPIGMDVEHFRKHGTLRTRPLRPPDDPFPSYKKLLQTREWHAVETASPDARSLQEYSGHVLLQVLALVRTAYDPPEARQPFAYLKPADYERFHKEFLAIGARWDQKLQMYVRPDGSHHEVGHLANIYR